MNVAPFGDAFLEGLMDGIGAWNVTGWDVWNSKIVENWFGRDLVIDNWELGDVFNNTHLIHVHLQWTLPVDVPIQKPT